MHERLFAEKLRSGRTAADWRDILMSLLASLSAHCQLEFNPTSWYVHDDVPGEAYLSNGVNFRGVLNPTLDLHACGALCVSGNVGSKPHASAEVLLFAGNSRLFGPGESDAALLDYRPSGWTNMGWMAGEREDWENTLTDERWRVSDL